MVVVQVTVAPQLHVLQIVNLTLMELIIIVTMDGVYRANMLTHSLSMMNLLEVVTGEGEIVILAKTELIKV